jgi:MFS family permease
VDKPAAKSPFKVRNVRLFIAFRIFFNARFYYPVFTILFLDFGLTLQQFALLNAVWAASIVLFEVPSGALADTFGRRKLLVVTGALMVIEMTLLCVVPRGNADLLFAVFLVNRVFSGAAEAAASGADEAITYDTLKKEGLAQDWPMVLEKQMRMQSIAYIGAMSIGAAVYDPSLMQRLAHLLGLNVVMTQGLTLRFPLFLTLIMAVMTLLTALRLQEEKQSSLTEHDPRINGGRPMFQALKLTLQAGLWILRTPFALVVILAGLIFDNCIRMVITLCSQYYRLIHLPEGAFGLINSGFAVLGLLIPRMAFKMVNQLSPAWNLAVMAVVTIAGLFMMTFFLPVIGLLPVALLFSVMYMGRFFQSHYLNRITASHQRATVLSFRGLSFNLAYGIIGVLYSLLLAYLRPRAASHPMDGGGIEIENLIFIKSMTWFPWYFILTMTVLLIFARWRLRETDVHKRPG